MALNKTRKRLIRKFRKKFNSYPVGIKFSTDGGKTFSGMGNIQCASVIRSGSISASKLQSGEISFRNFEITISQGFTKEEFNKLNGGVL